MTLRCSPQWPTGASTVVGTIGYPVSHSMSPLLHQAAFDALGLDWVSVAFAVQSPFLLDALTGMAALGIAGLSVTMPHKARVAAAVDELTPLAERLDAVNCVINRDGILLGDSTDGAGLLQALYRATGTEPAGLRCVVIGAGGAARAAIAALGDAGAAEVVVVNRTESRAADAAQLAGPVGRTGGPESLGDADLIIHATPSGMAGMDTELAIPEREIAGRLHPGQVVMDLVYVPRVTPFMRQAEICGATAVGGLGMLVHQAAIAIEHWTGRQAPLEQMWAAAAGAMGD